MEKKYGIWTSIAMIIGIVIGSGIFFKVDEILIASNGDVLMSSMALLVSAISIIFGAITVSRLARLTDKSGGAIAYFEEFYSRKMGAGFGWFQTFVYFPALVAVISFVVGMYISMLAGIDQLGYQVLIGAAVMFLLFGLNILLPRLSGGLQILCTVAKILPLILIAGFGLFAGKHGFEIVDPNAVAQVTNSEGTGSFLLVLLPVIFSYDGWIVATSISKEIKNERRNLPLALFIAPIVVLLIYLAYFLGLVRMVGIEHILTHGDQYLYQASEAIFGENGKVVILVFVVISVIGTLNGLILGYIRLPESLRERGFIGGARYDKVANKIGSGVLSGIIALFFAVVYAVVNYLVTRFDLLQGGDIGELTIVSQYLLFILLYYKVFSLWRKRKVKGVFYGVICPLLAAAGSVMIFVCGFAHWLVFTIGLLLVISVFMAGALYINFKDKKNPPNAQIEQDGEGQVEGESQIDGESAQVDCLSCEAQDNANTELN